MNSKAIATVLFLSISFTAIAQREGGQYTLGAANGRFWKQLRSLNLGVNWLDGYSEGLTASTTIETQTPNFSAKLTALFPSAMNFGEIATALDRFFDVPENAPIPVIWALMTISKKASGSSDAEVAEMTRSFRAMANDPAMIPSGAHH